MPKGISSAEWDRRFAECCARQRGRYVAAGGGSYLEPPSSWAAAGDRRLERLRYDPDPAALALCSFLESQTARLRERASGGARIVACMKDLSTVPTLLAAAGDRLACFSADMAFMQPTTSEDPRLLDLAAERGLGESFCDVRAAVGALAAGDYWPRPDLCVAAVGGCCDDFSACMQQVAAMGFPTHFWELPEVGDEPTAEDLAFLVRELEGLRRVLSEVLELDLSDGRLAAGLARVDRLRALIREIRELAYAREAAPLAALECLLVEALAVDFGSDLEAATALLEDVAALCRRRTTSGDHAVAPDAVRLVWVTPCMDVCLQNELEDLGARVAGTEYMIGHGFGALDARLAPLEALARSALADPMIGSSARRARIVCEEAARRGAEGVVLVSFFGASHCVWEERIIAGEVRARLGLPVLTVNTRSARHELDAQVRGRLGAFVETIRARRAGRVLSAVELAIELPSGPGAKPGRKP